MNTIDVISDTHSRHGMFPVPGGDLLIHAGDCTSNGSKEAIWQFINWMEPQLYTHKVLIPGNHDWGFEKNFAYWKDECEKRNIHLLNDSGITIDGVSIWGSATTPFFNNWAFNRHRGADIRRHWDLIPEETEILVTHGPPQGILDMTFNGDFAGCDDLLEKILRSKVKAHFFGHIHEGRGTTYKHGKTFVNAAALNARYQPVEGCPIRILREDGDYIVAT